MKKIAFMVLVVLCSMSFGDACFDECLQKTKYADRSYDDCYDYCYNNGGDVSDEFQGGQGSQGISDAMFPAFDAEVF